MDIFIIDGSTTIDDTVLLGAILDDNALDAVLNTVDVVVRVVVPNMMAGMTPLIALPRGVVKSRLTALAVYEYSILRSKSSKVPSTMLFLPTVGTVMLVV